MFLYTEEKTIKLLADIVFILESTKTDINLLEDSEVVKKNILDKYEKTIKEIKNSLPENINLENYNKLLKRNKKERV